MPINYFTGKIINESAKHNLSKMMGIGFGTEIIYSFIIITCSLMIYFGTKELYELSSHKGIKYFREAFLFFALAYFFRSIIKFTLFYLNVGKIFDIYPKMLYFGLGEIALFIFIYFNSIAIFYLLYSIMWKKWGNKEKAMYIFHAVSIILALFSILFKIPLAYLGINFLLLIFVMIIFFISHNQQKNKKTKHNLHIIYFLIFLFWIINIIDILIPNFFKAFQLFIYLASSGLFFAMLYKVLKKTGFN